jgi:hypothetical protein
LPIVQRNLRSKQIRPALLAAPEIGTVAASTFHAVHLAPARDDCRIAWLALLGRKGRDAAATAAARGRWTLCSWSPRRRRLGWRLCRDGENGSGPQECRCRCGLSHISLLYITSHIFYFLLSSFQFLVFSF